MTIFETLFNSITTSFGPLRTNSTNIGSIKYKLQQHMPLNLLCFLMSSIKRHILVKNKQNILHTVRIESNSGFSLVNLIKSSFTKSILFACLDHILHRFVYYFSAATISTATTLTWKSTYLLHTLALLGNHSDSETMGH